MVLFHLLFFKPINSNVLLPVSSVFPVEHRRPLLESFVQLNAKRLQKPFLVQDEQRLTLPVSRLSGHEHTRQHPSSFLLWQLLREKKGCTMPDLRTQTYTTVSVGFFVCFCFKNKGPSFYHLKGLVMLLLALQLYSLHSQCITDLHHHTFCGLGTVY